jgi:hypothetical protein
MISHVEKSTKIKLLNKSVADSKRHAFNVCAKPYTDCTPHHKSKPWHISICRAVSRKRTFAIVISG